MNLERLLSELSLRNVQLKSHGSELKIQFNHAGKLEAFLIEGLKKYKADLLGLVSSNTNNGDWWCPEFKITPDMLPLVALSTEEIELITSKVDGGARGVQDIYPLAPLQEGILFHNLMSTEGDPYVSWAQFGFESRQRLDEFTAAFQKVVDRHDILRTLVLWEGLPEPVQVVMRKAALEIRELILDPAAGDTGMQLRQRFDPRHYRLDVSKAPLLEVYIARDEAGNRWIAHYLFHHLVADHMTLEILQLEALAIILGQADQLPKPVPYRNYVAQARLGVSREEHEEYFRALLSGVSEPSAPYGIMDVQGDGSGIREATLVLEKDLSGKLRAQARSLGVSAASLCHLAWALVVSRLSGMDDVVFGTVLFGRMEGVEGSERIPGLFINTLPVRVGLGADDVREAVKKTHAQLSELMRHEHAALSLAQRCSGVAAPAPLFTALLNYRHSSAPVQTGGRQMLFDGIEILGWEERTNYPFSLSVDDYGELFGLSAQVAGGIDHPEAICGYMRTALAVLTQALEQQRPAALNSLSILSGEQHERLLEGWNDTGIEYPRDTCIHELFEARAASAPDSTAVLFEEAALSYGGLNEQANRLAHHLRSLGVGPDKLVAICAKRLPAMVAGVLGVLKAGGAYVPLDPSYPLARLEYMIQDSKPAVILKAGVSQEIESLLASVSGAASVLDLETDAGAWAHCPADNPAPEAVGLNSRHLAYVIYTSGSTGNPKGVMIEHAGVINYLCWAAQAYHPDKGSLVSSSLSFDATVTSLLTPLTCGSPVRLIPEQQEVESLLEAVRQPGCGLVKISPLLLNLVGEGLVAAKGTSDVDVFIIGGEALSPATVRMWQEIQPGIRMINEYGPTETVVGCVVYDIPALGAGAGSNVPIGRPIANTRIYILDQGMRPVPVGVTGEIYIGGAGVGRGYLNRPELTAERFIADPFVDEPGARMYKSGDLARWLPDGNIEFLGRNDFQVKIRGFRIELGEIEARLREHPGLRDAVVEAWEDSAGEKRLAAYYLPQAGDGGISAEDLRAYLLENLPDYMVPAAYIELAQLPLTSNGKLDRGALPRPDGSAFISREYEEPVGEVEKALAGIWAEVLQVQHVGRHDNFFELGGHSLLGVKLVNRMRQAGLHADVRDLFTASTLADLAAMVNTSAKQLVVPPNLIPDACENITPEMLPLVELSAPEIELIESNAPGGVRNIQDIYPLAPLQEGILFHHLMSSEGDPYVLWTQFAFDSRARLDAFIQAFGQVIARHDILRTCVLWEGLAAPVQVVLRQAALSIEELKLDPADGDICAQLKERFDPRHYRLNVSQAPLIRVFVAHDEAGSRWVVHYLFHHLIADHTTMEVLQEEAFVFQQGQGNMLPEPVPYRNYVAQARLGLSPEEHEMYFRSVLADVDEPTAPCGMSDVQGDGSDITEATMLVDEQLSRALRAQARALGVSAASLCHTAWAHVIAHLSGKDDVVFGTVLLGRMDVGSGTERVPGLFINTLPVRVKLDDTDMRKAVRKAHAQLSELMRHEHAPLSMAQRCSSVAAPAPLFTALLNYRHNALPADMAEHRMIFEGVEIIGGEERTNYPFTLSVDDYGDDFGLTAQVAGGIDPAEVCGYMHTALASLAQALEPEQSVPLKKLPVMGEAGRRRLLVEWNATEADYPRDMCIHELIETQALRTPGNPAVSYGDVSLSYAQLNEQANRLAHHLRALGVGPDKLVAICARRLPAMVAGVLGVLKAGGAYVPLDPAYPAARLEYMLQDSAPVVILKAGVSGEVETLLARVSGATPVLDLEADAATWAHCPAQNPAPDAAGLTSRHLAYVIYTSGSTGMPKGVMIEHAGVMNYLWWARQAYHPDKGSLVSSSLSFDATVTSLLTPLTCGSPVRLVPEQQEVETLLAEVQRTDCGLVKISPLLLNMVGESLKAGNNRSDVDAFIIGGEALAPATVRMWREIQPGIRMVNEYGPTETVVGCIVYDIPPLGSDAGSNVPIGRPIANTRIYILDSHLQPVPVGVAGEIYIGGAGVGRGYLNRPELTDERFIADPFSGQPEARMYKSGDLARYLPDGNIEFLGRNDFQVKIRGFRIEPGEIEACIRQYPGVRDAVVQAWEDSAGEKRLAAYYLPQAGQTSVAVEDLRASLLEQLPDYMVPAAYMELAGLPLTSNGKLDRGALPRPDGQAFISRAYEEPVGEVEEALAAIWREVLHVERVGRRDNFFELGGHSLLAVRLVNRMRQAGLHADVRDMFTATTLADLAATIGSGSDRVIAPQNQIPQSCEEITPAMLPLVELSEEEIAQIADTVPGGAANIQDIYPLAPLQEGILFHHLMSSQGDPYLLWAQLSFASRERLDAFIEAFQWVIDRHDILRTAVCWQGLPQPVQVVMRRAKLEVEELELDVKDGDIAGQLRRLFDSHNYRLDVSQAPLQRIVLAHDAARGRWIMHFMFHHLVSDHTTLEILQHEAFAYLLGQADKLEAPVPYRDYVAQALLGMRREEHEQYFRALLGDVDEPTAPYGLMDVRGDGSGVTEATLDVDKNLGRAVRAQARALGVSAASLCHVAWAQVVARLSGRDDAVFGTVLFGRIGAGEGSERVPGLFINTLPVRIHTGADGAVECVRKTHAQLSGLMRHEHAPLSLAQRCSSVPAPAPLFTALLNYRHNARTSEADAQILNLEGIEILDGEERTNYPITFSVDDFGDGFSLTAQTAGGIDPAEICGYMHTALGALVQALEHAPLTTVGSLKILSDAQREYLLKDLNDTFRAYPREKCVHTVFEDFARTQPANIALTSGEERLSYAELNARANRLGHYLREKGVGPDTFVAICAQRSTEMMVGLLAILKAGGAYVPLDPAYPQARLEYMVQDCKPVAILTHRQVSDDVRGGLQAVAGGDCLVLDLLEDAAQWAGMPAGNPDPAAIGLTSGHLAYVIYTSGSTGMPKGVCVTHRNINRTVINTNYFTLQPGDRMAHASNISFDAATFEVWGALLQGAELVIIPKQVLLSEEDFAAELKIRGVNAMFLTTALFNHYVQHAPQVLSQMKYMVFGGDAADAHWVKELMKQGAPGHLINGYGPTETTTFATTYEVRPDEKGAAIPIGRPLSNTSIYVLDTFGNPVPLGVAGELYIGGDGVARGYLNRDELSAGRFVPDTFGGQPGAKLYKTGDLARYLPDGNIEFLGRNDFQVKIRGFRIELGEIEARLKEHPGIREAVVLAREGGGGEKRLVGYYTPASASEGELSALSVEQIKEHLSANLPDYMVPAAYVVLENLPITNNGKLDRRALPEPDVTSFISRVYEEPEGEVEEALARIWSEVLQVERVGRHDNFFELGGHSLLAVRLINRMRQEGLEADVRDLFTASSLAELAEKVDYIEEIEI